MLLLDFNKLMDINEIVEVIRDRCIAADALPFISEFDGVEVSNNNPRTSPQLTNGCKLGKKTGSKAVIVGP